MEIEPQIESAAPEGEAIVFVDGEPKLTDEQRRKWREAAQKSRDKKKAASSPRDKARWLLKEQGITLPDELFEQLWSKYCDYRERYAESQLGFKLADFWVFRCPDPHGDHGLDRCNGISAVVEILWPAECVSYVADQLKLEPYPRFEFLRTASVERKNELVAAVEWLKAHGCCAPKIEADLKAALATK